MLALLFSVQSIASVQATAFALPIAQLYYDAVGKRLTLMCLTVVCLAQFMAAVTAFTASSRLFYALSRDDAFPMKKRFMALNRFQAPYWGVWLSVLVGCIISCAYIGSAIAVSDNYVVARCFNSSFPAVQRNSVVGCDRGHAELPATHPDPGLLAFYVNNLAQISLNIIMLINFQEPSSTWSIQPRPLVMASESCECTGKRDQPVMPCLLLIYS